MLRSLAKVWPSCYKTHPFAIIIVLFTDDDVVDDLNESESVEVNAKEEEEVLEPKPEEVKPVKKIVLNRQNHIEIEAPKEASATEVTTPGADDADKKPTMSATEVAKTELNFWSIFIND